MHMALLNILYKMLKTQKQYHKTARNCIHFPPINLCIVVNKTNLF